MQESLATSLPSVVIILLLLAAPSSAARLRRFTSTQSCDAVSLVRGCFCHQGHSGHLEVNCHNLILTQMPAFGPAPNGETINIESIHITGNEVLKIDDRAFRGITIKKLYLPYIGLQRIHNQAFADSAGTLAHLDLSHNELSEIPAAITNLTALKTLILTDNDINVVDWSIVRNLGQNGGSLYLDKNPIQSYRQKPESNFFLKKLVIGLKKYFQHNYHGQDIFKGIPRHVRPSLEFLLLTDTPVPSLKIQQDMLPNITFLGYERSAATVDAFESNCFRSVRAHLRGLSLARNSLSRIPSSALNKLKKLEHLDLSNNQIYTIRKLSKMPNLKTVDFSGNRIVVVWRTAMALPSLESVDISSNRLSTLLSDAIPVSQLTRFSIKDNPWQCSCKTRWLIELIQEDAREGEGPFSMVELFRMSDAVQCPNGDLIVNFDVRGLVCSDNITENSF